MRKERIPNRQYAAAVFTALLAPLLRFVPGMSAALGGRSAWMGAVLAWPMLLLLALPVNALRRLTPGEGMACRFLRYLGPVPGRLTLLLYAGWFLVLGGLLLRSGGERLAAAAYPQSRPEPFLLVTAALALLIALGTLGAAARMAAVIRAVLLVSLAGVLLLAAPGLRPENLFPPGAGAPVDALRGSLPVIAAGSVAALFTFLDGHREPALPSRGGTAGHTALFCGLAALLSLTVTGTYGAKLTARLTYPFFTMTRDIRLGGLAQRVEALIIALWVFADIYLCALLLRCAHEALRRVPGLPDTDGAPLFRLGNGRWLFWAEAAAMVLLGQLFAATPERFRLWLYTLAPLGTVVLTYGGFPLLWLAGRSRGKE